MLIVDRRRAVKRRASVRTSDLLVVGREYARRDSRTSVGSAAIDVVDGVLGPGAGEETLRVIRCAVRPIPCRNITMAWFSTRKIY